MVDAPRLIIYYQSSSYFIKIIDEIIVYRQVGYAGT